MTELKCPCDNSKLYANCCQLVHHNHAAAKTAETLMRSRYSAFALGNGKYLQLSHALATRPTPTEGIETEKWSKSVQWIELKVHNTAQGKASDTKGTVEFTAFFLDNGKMSTIHENSYFEKKNDKWYYFGPA